jgi:hypothetical protein
MHIAVAAQHVRVVKDDKELSQSERSRAMKRALLILTALVILGATTSQVQAHEYRHGYYGGYCAGYFGPYAVYPRVYPSVVYPPIVYPPVVYPPVAYPGVATYPYYGPGTATGFYYNGPRLSIGVGF